jgi:hypothetical protein
MNAFNRCLETIALATGLAIGSAAMATSGADDREARLLPHQTRTANGDAAAEEQTAPLHVRAAPREQRKPRHIALHLQRAAGTGREAERPVVLYRWVDETLPGDAGDYQPGPWGC